MAAAAGDAGGAGVVVAAAPGPAISAALSTVPGLAGMIAVDATSAFPSRNEAFASLAEEVKPGTGAPVAKSFNLNFAVLYDQIRRSGCRPAASMSPGDGARDITGQVITDAGYDPVPLGGLDRARAVEDLAWVLAAARKDGVSVCCRFAVPGEL